MPEIQRSKIDFREVAGRIPYVGSPLKALEVGDKPRNLEIDRVDLRNKAVVYARKFAEVAFRAFEADQVHCAYDFCTVNSANPTMILKAMIDGRKTFSQELFYCEDDQALENLREDTWCPVDGKDGVFPIASFSLSRDLAEWDMPHRLVELPYRGFRLGDAFLASNEAFAQRYADLSGESQCISVLPAQLSVIIWLLNNGYEGASDEDLRRIDILLNYEEGVSQPRLRMKNHDQRASDYWLQAWLPKGLYGTYYWGNFRIKLVKKREPRAGLRKEDLDGDIQRQRERVEEMVAGVAA